MNKNFSYRKGFVVVGELISCARCGNNHKNIEFKKLTKSDGEWTHWASCPKKNGEPILMKFVEE